MASAAERRGIEIVAIDSENGPRMIEAMKDEEVFAVLHVTC